MIWTLQPVLPRLRQGVSSYSDVEFKLDVAYDFTHTEDRMGGMYGSKDMKVTVIKAELLTKLGTNREKHIADYVAACKGYREAAIKALKEKLDAFEKGDHQQKAMYLDFSKLPAPVSHEVDYDRAIGLLKMHAEEKIILDMDAYERFVIDNWEWKSGFAHTNSAYLGG